MLSIINWCESTRKTYFDVKDWGLKIDISTKKYEIGLIGSNYGFQVLMPILKAIDGVNLTFAASDNMSLENKKVLRKAEVNILSQPEFFNYKNTKIVFVAAPPSSQLQISNLVLENKKNLYCEKPVGVNYIETLRIDELCKAQGKKAYVGFQFRFDPGIQALKELIELKILGEVNQIKVNWHTSGTSAKQDNLNWRNNINLGGGVHRDFLCHVLDYLKWITNNSITQSLQHLVLDPKIKSSIYKLNTISDHNKNSFISINISRGFESVSYWEILLVFENGKFLINSTFPFSVNGYRTQINGSKEFCLIAEEFINGNEFSNKSFKQGFARDYALSTYFRSIIKNVFEGNLAKLPDLEDAKFTQLISDQIQEQLILI